MNQKENVENHYHVNKHYGEKLFKLIYECLILSPDINHTSKVSNVFIKV